jgi:nucleotide-binding universal stress UspA family protein
MSTKYVVAYSADSGGRAALTLGRLFATAGIELAVCTIVPSTWGYPSMAAVDAEYGEFLAKHASAALDDARRRLGDDVPAEYLARAARTTTDGILELVDELDAALVVLGSARGGAVGRFAVGSVTSSLLHAAPVPVALAPRGFHATRALRVRRVTCGYLGSGHAAATAAAATEIALRHAVPLRLATAIVRDRQMYPSLVGYHSERQVDESAKAQAQQLLRQAVAELPEGLAAEHVVVDGATWDDAMDELHWQDGEVLVIGSSRRGLGRIFLGGNANKIVRSAPVPTVVVPGGAHP